MFIWEVNIIFTRPNALFYYRGNNKQLLYICYYEHLPFIQKYFFIRAAWRMCILHVGASVHCSQHNHVSCVCWFMIGLSHVERKWHSKIILFILCLKSRLNDIFLVAVDVCSFYHSLIWGVVSQNFFLLMPLSIQKIIAWVDFEIGTWGRGYLELITDFTLE